MTAILTPALALRHLRQLSTDVRAAVVLATADLAVLARESAETAPAGSARAAFRGETGRAGSRGEQVLAITDDEHVLAVVAGPHALLPLLHHDLATLLADMRVGRGESTPSSGVQVLERADSAVSAAIFAGLGIPAAGKS